jgi:dihydroorotate dehydrogenase
LSGALYRVLRRLFFQVDAEAMHHAALAAARLAETGLPALARPARCAPTLRHEVCGISFPTPIGLAAGFDKDGVAPHLWAALGFGFAELGTVTGKAQPGNPRPRIFRLPEYHAVINRMGFNSEGAASVAHRLAASLRRPAGIPLGINVGCSRAAVGDEARELDDISGSVRHLARFADYLALNVSSPNTPGLRDLQAPQRLGRLVEAVVAEAETGRDTGATAPPVFVKLAPDLPDEVLGEIGQAALAAGARGLIAVNTTISREGIAGAHAGETGGLSGAPLAARADECLVRLRDAVGPGPGIIGVGGIFSVADALRRIAAGADLIGLYTGLIYEGPGLAWQIATGIESEIAGRGLADFAALRDALRSGAPGHTPA